MDDIALSVQVQAFEARHSDGFPGSIVAFEELKGVASSYDTCSLIVEEVFGRTFQNCGVVAVSFEGYASEETAQRAADLVEIISRYDVVWIDSLVVQ